MSTESVQEIIGRAMADPLYRELVLTDLASAVKGYELTEEELASLRGLSREQFDAAPGELEERISRSAGFGIGGDATERGQQKIWAPSNFKL